MESIDFLFDSDFDKFESKMDSIEDNNIVENENHNTNVECVVNDVFLNQTNGLFDSILNNCKNVFNEKQLNSEESDSNEDLDDERESGFDEFLDDICSEESVDGLVTESLFGCICCNSCKLKSHQFVTKSNELIKQFKSQLRELKENIRQHLCDINSQINANRLKCARFLANLQLKLNERNEQLKKIVDLSQFLSNNNDFLSNQLKDDSVKFENVCKQNIKLRDKLGIQLKVVLSNDECGKAIKQIEKNRLNHSSVSSVEFLNKNVIKNVIKTKLEELSVNTVSDVRQTSPQSPIQLSQNNSYDLEQQIIDLLKKYDRFESFPTPSKKRRTDESSSPTEHQNCDTKYILRKHKEKFIEKETNCNNYANKLTEKQVLHSSAISHFSTPITTYSKLDISHKPLTLNKSSHKSFNNLSNNSQFNNIHPIRVKNGSLSKTNSIGSVDKKFYNDFNGSQLNRHYSNANLRNNQNEKIAIKIEPQSPQTPQSPQSPQKPNNNLVKMNGNNELKIKIKLPSNKKCKKKSNSLTASENSRFCKRCRETFPTLTQREFKQHLYENCPKREKKHKCLFCTRYFESSSALISHRKAKHKQLDNNKDTDQTRKQRNADSI